MTLEDDIERLERIVMDILQVLERDKKIVTYERKNDLFLCSKCTTTRKMEFEIETHIENSHKAEPIRI